MFSRSLLRFKGYFARAVLAAIGFEKLWSYLEQKMLELAPQRDLTRSMDLTIKLPPEVSSPFTIMTGFIRSAGAQKQKVVKAKLTEWKEGLDDVKKKLRRKFKKKSLKKLEKIAQHKS